MTVLDRARPHARLESLRCAHERALDHVENVRRELRAASARTPHDELERRMRDQVHDAVRQAERDAAYIEMQIAQLNEGDAACSGRVTPLAAPDQ